MTSTFNQQVEKAVAEALVLQQPVAFWGCDTAILANLYSRNLLSGLKAIFVSHSLKERSRELLGYTCQTPDNLKIFKPEKVIILSGDAITAYEMLVRELSFSPAQIIIDARFFNDGFYDPDKSAREARANVSHHITGGIGGDVSAHLYDALRHVARRNIPGDIVNLGVYQGWSMHYLAQLRDKLGLQDRRIWGFDTFGGFAGETHELDVFKSTSASVYKEWSNSSEFIFHDATLDLVRNNLKMFSNIELVKGDITETVNTLNDISVSVALFDMDDYTPTKASLPLLYERLSPHGFIVFDHYHWASMLQGTCLGQRLAMLEFNADAKLFNPVGTNMFIKI